MSIRPILGILLRAPDVGIDLLGHGIRFTGRSFFFANGQLPHSGFPFSVACQIMPRFAARAYAVYGGIYIHARHD